MNSIRNDCALARRLFNLCQFRIRSRAPHTSNAQHHKKFASDDRLALRQPFALAFERLRPFLVAESPWHGPHIGIAAQPAFGTFAKWVGVANPPNHAR